MKVLVFAQKIKKEDADLIKIFFEELHKLGAQICVNDDMLPQLPANGIDANIDSTVANYEDIKTFAPEIAITLGGDGTILHLVTYIRDLQVPILGINLGRLGFLANIEKSKIISAVRDVMARRYTYEERTLISLASTIPIFGETPIALNDFTIHKRDTSSMITIHTYIDGAYLNSYWADGIIVATPTGSTGYSMSCGGPIIFPGSGNWVITPVAPHSLNVRPLVISDQKNISFLVEGRTENFMCTLDSRNEVITQQHHITLSRCPYAIRIATLQNMDFMYTIREKLMWGIDKRN